MEAKSVRNMYSNIAVTNKHTAKLHHVGSLYILTYDARKLKHKERFIWFNPLQNISSLACLMIPFDTGVDLEQPCKLRL